MSFVNMDKNLKWLVAGIFIFYFLWIDAFSYSPNLCENISNQAIRSEIKNNNFLPKLFTTLYDENSKEVIVSDIHSNSHIFLADFLSKSMGVHKSSYLLKSLAELDQLASHLEQGMHIIFVGKYRPEYKMDSNKVQYLLQTFHKNRVVFSAVLGKSWLKQNSNPIYKGLNHLASSSFGKFTLIDNKTLKSCQRIFENKPKQTPVAFPKTNKKIIEILSNSKNTKII